MGIVRLNISPDGAVSLWRMLQGVSAGAFPHPWDREPVRCGERQHAFQRTSRPPSITLVSRLQGAFWTQWMMRIAVSVSS
jgi:hypothetical protein